MKICVRSALMSCVLTLPLFLIACNPDDKRDLNHSAKVMSPPPETPETSEFKLSEQQYKTAEMAMSGQLTLMFDQEIAFSEEFHGRSADWSLYCGTVTASDTPTRNTQSLELTTDDSFCGLVSKSEKGYAIVEFEYGSTDMYVLDWIQDYNLPEDILD